MVKISIFICRNPKTLIYQNIGLYNIKISVIVWNIMLEIILAKSIVGFIAISKLGETLVEAINSCN